MHRSPRAHDHYINYTNVSRDLPVPVSRFYPLISRSPPGFTQSRGQTAFFRFLCDGGYRLTYAHRFQSATEHVQKHIVRNPLERQGSFNIKKLFAILHVFKC